MREENYEPTYGALEYEDKMYGIPLEYNIEYGGMLVNDTLLKAKGLTVPKTWEELRKTAIEGTEHDGNIFQCKGFDFVNWDSVPYLFPCLYPSAGCGLHDGGRKIRRDDRCG